MITDLCKSVSLCSSFFNEMNQTVPKLSKGCVKMNRIYRSLSLALVTVMLMSLFPVSASADSSEIWSGYPGVDQLPVVDTIPDLFQFFNNSNDPTGDGYVSTKEEWDARRAEIKELVQHYWLGYRWPTKPEDVSGATVFVTVPNEITVGFLGSKVNLYQSFNTLVNNLLAGQVQIHELIPGTGFGPQTLGDVKYTFGPASDAAEAEAMAIEAWNAGYYVTYASFGGNDYTVLKNSTGEIFSPPAETKVVSNNTITIKNPDTNVEASFNITLTMPTPTQIKSAWGDENVQVPVIIDIGGAVSQVATVNAQGYAHINFTPTTIYPDNQSTTPNRNGVYTKLYPYNKDVYEYASGALMAWGWGVSQIISALEQPTTDGDNNWGELLQVDPTRTLVTGHSRYGKAAMFAAAFDDRISICLPSESGGAGIQSYRYKVEGKIFNFNTYPKADRVYGKTEIPTVSYGSGNSWFPETAAEFVNKDNQFPFDSSDIISLIAPRPFLATTGIDAHWLGNEGAVAAVQAASEVYAFIGRDEIENNNIAVRARESNHVLYNRDLPFVIAIMDREFKQIDDNKLHVKDLFPDGNGLGNMSYPAQDYNYISEFNSYPFDINSSYLPWSSPDKYTLWTAQENFLVGYPVNITAHSNAPDVKLYMPNGTVIDAVSHEGEVFTFALAAEQAVYGRYELQASGAEKLSREVHFAAVSLADSLRHATSKGDEGEENRLIGFSSRLANNADNPPLVLVDGKQVTMSFTPARVKPEETTLLEYGILFHDPLFVRIANEGWNSNKTFDIKNLNFVTIPGFTFEISFGNIYASAANSGKDGAANFTQPISWNVEKFNNGPADVWPIIPDTPAERIALLAGDTVERPDAPAPKATAFNAEIVETNVEIIGDRTNVIIDFDTELDPREYGFGIDVANDWETSWSDDNKQITLSIDRDKFPEGASANIILFHLKDTNGNMIRGPQYLTITAPDDTPVALGGKLTGPNSVLPGQGFDIIYGLQGVEGDVLAQDITITYDTEKVEYIPAPTTLNANKFTVIDYEVTPGEIRILGGYLGDVPVDHNGDLMKVSFRAKNNIMDETAKFEISELMIGDTVGETSLPGVQIEVQIKGINTATLGDLIENATEILEQAVEGKHIGQYPVGSKAALEAAIQRATTVYTKENATQASIDLAIMDLQNSLQKFLDSVIVSIPGDFNNDAKVSVADLAAMVHAYGLTSSDPTWSSVKHFDFNNDNVIDIKDLVVMARMILNW